jgi:hypothetical protein
MDKYTKEQALKLVEEAYDEGMPIFILQAKDRLAPYVIKRYADMLKDSCIAEYKDQGDDAIFSSNSYKLASTAEEKVSAMFTWQGSNFEKVKLPD